jgi:hypothetical protein
MFGVAALVITTTMNPSVVPTASAHLSERFWLDLDDVTFSYSCANSIANWECTHRGMEDLRRYTTKTRENAKRCLPVAISQAEHPTFQPELRLPAGFV